MYGSMKALLKKLDLIIDLLLKDREDRKAEKEALAEEKKEKQRAEAEQMLVEYAKRKSKKLPPGGVWNGRAAADRPVHSDGDLIPFDLSARDKELLRQFYDT